MPSIIYIKHRWVIKYLNKHKCSKVNFIRQGIGSDLDGVVALQLDFIDSLNPNLKVDLVAR